MKKYLLSAVFTFLEICFAQDLSIEEQLRILGADDFFVSDIKAQPDTDTAQITREDENSKQADSLDITDNAQTQSDSARTNNGASSESGRHRQPMTSVSSMTPAGAGQGRPAFAVIDTIINNCRNIDGNEICDTTFNIADVPAEKVSVFDTASVAEERTIDFSRNLSQYRSPQKAFLYSLFVPGLGQAYNKNYWRTGLYAAIETGMITGAVYFRKDARKIRENAENFADTHFDKNELKNFYKELTKYGYDKFSDNPKDTVNFINIGNLIFGGGAIFFDKYDSSSGVFEKYAYEEYMEQFDEDFYGNISGSYGTQGWDDAVYRTRSGLGDAFSIDTAGVTVHGERGFGISQNQRRFNSLIDESEKQGRRSSAFVVGIFANHIASAMDAFLSTIIHNRKLLRDEKGKPATKAEEILGRISIDGDMYLNKSGELTSILGLVWRF